MRPARNSLGLELVNVKLVKVLFDISYQAKNALRPVFFFKLLSAYLLSNNHVLF